MANPLGPSGPRRTGDGPAPSLPRQARPGSSGPLPDKGQPEAPRPGHPSGAPKDAEPGRNRRVADAAPRPLDAAEARRHGASQPAPDAFAPKPSGGPKLALGLLIPAEGVSAARPHVGRSLPGLPRPYRPAGKIRLGQRFHALLSAWLATPARQQEEATSHAVPPVVLLAWRKPQGAAALTVPLPHAAALAAVGVRARPKWPEPSSQAVLVAVAAKPSERTGAPAAGAAPHLGDEAAPRAPEPSPTGLAPALSEGPVVAPMTSLRAPKAPTALLLGLAAPRRSVWSPKGKAAPARPKKKARQWARLGADPASGEVDEAHETGEPPDEPEPSGRRPGRSSS